MKKCPYCAEEIQDEAIVCRYCGRNFEAELPPEDRKKCPHCAEWIRAEATACRYCGRDLTKEERSVPEEHEPTVSKVPPEKAATIRPWYRQLWFYVLTFLFFWPLCAILVITDKQLPNWFRFIVGLPYLLIAISVVVIVFLALVGPIIDMPVASNPTPAGYSKLTTPTTHLDYLRTQWAAAPTKRPTIRSTKTPACISPEKVTAQDKGKTIVVCGRIVQEGELNCPSCEYGVYYYLYFEGGFNIISYDWNFDSSMRGLCVMASDKVELLAGNPVFVFGSAEGYAGSKCSWEADGTKHCVFGDYFRTYTGCK